MALFDKIKDAVKAAAELTQKAAKTAAEKANDTIEIGKLKRAISFENSKMAANKTQIGEYYYGQFLKGQTLPLEVVTLCEGIKLCEEVIGQKQAEIDSIRAMPESEPEEEIVLDATDEQDGDDLNQAVK